MDIHILPALNDNYVYLFRDDVSGLVGVVDPPDAGMLTRELDRRGWTLNVVFNTHHHDDHIAGDLRLKARFRCGVVASGEERKRIPEMDVSVAHGDTYPFGAQRVEVIGTPGHTRGHLAFYFPDSGAVFSGDALFSLGCGRMFEGTAADMWPSLLRLRALPPETKVYAGHEYTLANAAFARTIEPENKDLEQRIAEARELRAQGLPTMPTTISRERATNPFLRADEPSVQASVGMSGADPEAVFAEVRRRKDRF